MIPFARVLKYGNTVKLSTKVKQVSHRLDTLVLWEDGQLWGSGYNRYGQISGTASNTNPVKEWTKISDGVDEILGAWNSGFALKMKNGQLFAAGDLPWAAAGTQASLIDVTDKLLVPGKTITQYSFSGTCVMCVTSDNILYGLSSTLSRGVLGNGVTIGAQYSFIQLATGVRKCVTDGNESFYITTAGRLWCTGWNNAGSLGTANSTQVNTWQLSPTAPVNVVDIKTSYSLAQLVINTGVVYICGNNATGAGSAKTSFTSIPPATVLLDLNKNYVLGCSGATLNTSIMLNPANTTLYYSGTMAYLGTGTTSNMNLMTTTYPKSSFVSDELVVEFGYESSMWHDKHKIYFTGQQRYIPGYPSTAANVGFSELQFPAGTDIT